MDHLETEVKFYIGEVSSVRDKILDFGTPPSHRIFETNFLFDDKSKRLLENRSLLRLRRDVKTSLTFKTKPESSDDNFKVLRELEVEVSDFAAMSRILEFLGYRRERVYEKWRETFLIEGSSLCLDTMPYGNFLEIEGEKENIRNLAKMIGLKWEERITLNYLELFNLVSNQYDLFFSDITFENFKNLEVDFNICLPEIRRLCNF